MGLKMSKLAVDTQTVLKTLGFLLQVFFDFSSHFLVDRNSWWLKNPTKTRGSYAPSRGLWRLEGGEVPALWTRVNHIPLKGQKNKRRVVLGSTQDSFYSEGKYRLVQIWQRQTALFSVLKEFWAASFGFCYLSSSLRSHRNRHHNRWRLMIPKPYGESTHVKLGPFFFKKKNMNNTSNLQSWFIEATFKVDSSKQPSKLLHWTNPPKPIYTKIERVNSDPAKFGRVQFLPFRLGTFTGDPCRWRWRSAKCSGPSYRNVTRSWQRWRRPRRPWRCLGSATKTQGKSAEFIESKPTTIF